MNQVRKLIIAEQEARQLIVQQCHFCMYVCSVVRVRMAGNMNYRRGWAALEIEKWQGWSEMTLRGNTASAKLA